MRRESQRAEGFDKELQHLLDEQRPQPEPPEPVVENEGNEERRDPKRVRVEAGTHS
jgi:hypothetical protein